MKLKLLIALLLPALLVGCTEKAPLPTEPAQRYTVRFLAGGQNISVQTLAEGSYPSPPRELPGYILAGWLDESGLPTAPEASPLEDDRSYTALVYPDLRGHRPYLFPDESGDLRPDAVLTAGELRLALEALAADPAALESISLPRGAVTDSVLRSALHGCFPEYSLAAAFRFLPAGALTRANFARVMNSLLDRDTEELLIPEEGALLPRDLDLTRSDSAALLEACLPHHGDPQGLPMAEAILEMPWQPGFTNLGGFLYLADESGRLLRSEAYQSLTFGPDGRLTSGDPELDDTVAEILNQIICANPDGTRMEWLEESYRYCRDRIVYVPRDLLDFGAEGWENEIGKAALRELAGNCYGYAAAFCLLARGLGYDAWCVSGLALENRGSHGWVEMELDGTLYVFDPEVEHQYMASREDLDLFKMDYYHASGWLYIRP